MKQIIFYPACDLCAVQVSVQLATAMYSAPPQGAVIVPSNHHNHPKVVPPAVAE